MLNFISMKTLSFALILYYYIGLISAQAPNPAQILSKIHSTQNDTLKASSYFQLSQLTKYQDLVLARKYADSAILFYQKMKSQKGIEERKYAEAGFLLLEGKYNEAIAKALEYQNWTLDAKDLEREWYAVSMLANCYRESGRYEEGIKALLRGIDIGILLKREDENGFFYNELGNIYSTLKQWKTANNYFQKAYDNAVKTKFLPGQSVSLRNIAQNFIELKEFDLALENINKTFELDSLANYKIGACRSYQLAGKIEEKKGNTANAIGIYHQALNKLQGETIENDFAILYQALARNYLKINQYEQAGMYLKLANEKLKKTDQAEVASENMKLNAEYFARAKKYEEAFNSLNQFVEKNEKELNENITKQITGLNIQFETEKKENQIALLSTEKKLADQKLKAARKQNIAAVITALLFSILSYYIFRLWNKTKHQNEIIKKSLSEKETLLKEIHHRVKNNLQFISSLLNLQARHVEDVKAIAALQEGQNRVKSMALIHQNLYQEQNLTGIEVKKYLEILIKNLFQSYNISPDRIQLESDIDPLNLDVDTMIPLGLVLNELISNSLKYAFPGDKNGKILIRLKEEKNMLLLEVRDNGVGISEISKNQLGKSFGYRMINAFSNQLDAQLRVENDNGTVVSLQIKDYKKAA